MPLIKDGLNRGAHSWHVYAHKKLGRHQTVIRAAWQLVNQLVDRSDVVQIELGRIIAHRLERRYYRQGIQCQQQGRQLQMICAAPDAVQFATVTFRVGTDLQELSREIVEEGFDWIDMVPHAPEMSAHA